jgi:hypothetical protein
MRGFSEIEGNLLVKTYASVTTVTTVTALPPAPLWPFS